MNDDTSQALDSLRQTIERDLIENWKMDPHEAVRLAAEHVVRKRDFYRPENLKENLREMHRQLEEDQ